MISFWLQISLVLKARCSSSNNYVILSAILIWMVLELVPADLRASILHHGHGFWREFMKQRKLKRPETGFVLKKIPSSFLGSQDKSTRQSWCWGYSLGVTSLSGMIDSNCTVQSDSLRPGTVFVWRSLSCMTRVLYRAPDRADSAALVVAGHICRLCFISDMSQEG